MARVRVPQIGDQVYLYRCGGDSEPRAPMPAIVVAVDATDGRAGAAAAVNVWAFGDAGLRFEPVVQFADRDPGAGVWWRWPPSARRVRRRRR